MSHRLHLLLILCLASPRAGAAAGDSSLDLALHTQARGGEVHYRVQLAGHGADVRDLRVVVALPEGFAYRAPAANAAGAASQGPDGLVFPIEPALSGDWSRTLEFRARVTSPAARDQRVTTRARARFTSGDGEPLETPEARTITYGDSVAASGTRAVKLPRRAERGSGALRSAEAGAFVFESDREEPGWNGQRVQLLGDVGELTTAQLELLRTSRAGETGQLGSLAVWQDLPGRFSTFLGASFSDDAPFPRRRGDLELHWKVPGLESLMLAAGAGRAEFDDGHARLWSGGATYWFRPLGGGALAYRFSYFDNRFERTSLRGVDGIGRSHLVSLELGRPEHTIGQLRLHYLSASDALSEFVAVSGRDESFSSHAAGLAWRRRWTRHVGTHVGFEWERRRDLFRRKGVDLRLIYYF